MNVGNTGLYARSRPDGKKNWQGGWLLTAIVRDYNEIIGCVKIKQGSCDFSEKELLPSGSFGLAWIFTQNNHAENFIFGDLVGFLGADKCTVFDDRYTVCQIEYIVQVVTD